MSGNVSQTSDGHKRQCLGASVSHGRGGGQARGSVLQSPSSDRAHPYASIDDLVWRVRDAPPREEVQHVPLEWSRAFWESRDIDKSDILALLVKAFKIENQPELDINLCDAVAGMHRGNHLVNVGALVDFSTIGEMVDMSVLNSPFMAMNESLHGMIPVVKIEGSGLSTALNAIVREDEGSGFEAATENVRSVVDNLTDTSRLFFPLLISAHIVLVDIDFGKGVCKVYDDSRSRSYEEPCKKLFQILFQFVRKSNMARVVSPGNIQFVYGKTQDTNACCIHALFNLVNCLADEPMRQELKGCNPSEHRASVTLAIMSLLEDGYSPPVRKPSERK